MELCIQHIAPEGSLSGSLRPDDGGTEISVAGQNTGRAMNLAFDLGNGQDADRYMFGVGTAWQNVTECNSPMGGPLVGPLPGNSDDWGPFPQAPAASDENDQAGWAY